MAVDAVKCEYRLSYWGVCSNAEWLVLDIDIKRKIAQRPCFELCLVHGLSRPSL